MPIGVLLFWIDAAHLHERGAIDPRTRENAGENALGGAIARVRRESTFGVGEPPFSPASV
jgi:hypothetical protein